MTVPTNTYDDGFPSEVAGHVDVGSDYFDDGAVNAVSGVDVGYTGDAQHEQDESDATVTRLEGVGARPTNDAIESYHRDAQKAQERQSVALVASVLRCDTIVLKQSNRELLVNSNVRRASITITNQGASDVSIGGETATGLGLAGTCRIPVGAFRTLYVTGKIYVVGAAGAIVDIAEESY